MDDLANRLRAGLARTDGVVFAYLFGSRARGSARPDSDIDLAVFVGRAERARLHFDIHAALAPYVSSERLHLVFLDTAPPGLVFRVFRDGVLLLDRDPPRRVRFIASNLGKYQDMERMRLSIAEADRRRLARRG